VRRWKVRSVDEPDQHDADKQAHAGCSTQDRREGSAGSAPNEAHHVTERRHEEQRQAYKPVEVPEYAEGSHVLGEGLLPLCLLSECRRHPWDGAGEQLPLGWRTHAFAFRLTGELVAEPERHDPVQRFGGGSEPGGWDDGVRLGQQGRRLPPAGQRLALAGGGDVGRHPTPIVLHLDGTGVPLGLIQGGAECPLRPAAGDVVANAVNPATKADPGPADSLFHAWLDLAGRRTDGVHRLAHRAVDRDVPSDGAVGRVFFKIPVGDFHCGIRAFDREKALALGLRSDGMEFASEIIVKFALTHHRIVEVPTVLRRDGRDRPPHLRSWRDGWRHLRFLLLFSPRWLFLYPGAGLAALGALLMLRLILGPLTVGSTVLDTQSLLFAGGAVVIGSQAILFAVLSRTYAAARGILPTTSRLRATAHPFALERGLFLGSALLGLGGIGAVVAVLTWAHHGFGVLSLAASMRLAIPTVTCLSLGAECFMGSFFLGLLQFDQHISAAPCAGPLAESSDMPDLLAQGELR